MMRALLSVANCIERAICRVGFLSGWLLLALMGVIVGDVILRRWFVIGSTAFQELEWHLHGAIFLLALGYAYLNGAHVRIELVHERLSVRKRAWVEFIGLLLALLPYCAAILWFGFDYAERAFITAETSPSPAGLPMRWIIKSVLVLSFAQLALAGLARLVHAVLYLFGPDDIAKDTNFARGDATLSHPERERT